MRLELCPLPVSCELGDEESGQGYLLRCAQANGITLDRLMAHAGVRTPTWLKPGDIEHLAFLSGISPNLLAFRLSHRQTVAGRREFDACGHRWMSATALRGRTPQVCPPCLKDANRCCWVWDLAGYCACVRHRVYLASRCRYCKKALAWSRPSPDICSCGRYLAAYDDAEPVPHAALAWCRWLAESVGGETVRATDPAVPGWLTQAGVDGAFQILMCFGRRDQAGRHLGVTEAVRMLAPQEMGACLCRGLARLADLPMEGQLPKELAVLVDEPRLERLARHGVQAGARRIATRLLTRIRREAPLEQLRHPWRSARPILGQLELFPDGGGS